MKALSHFDIKWISIFSGIAIIGELFHNSNWPISNNNSNFDLVRLQQEVLGTITFFGFSN